MGRKALWVTAMVNINSIPEQLINLLKNREILEDTLECHPINECAGLQEYRYLGEECVVYIKKTENDTSSSSSKIKLLLTGRDKTNQVYTVEQEAEISFFPRKELTKVVLTIYW